MALVYVDCVAEKRLILCPVYDSASCRHKNFATVCGILEIELMPTGWIVHFSFRKFKKNLLCDVFGGLNETYFRYNSITFTVNPSLRTEKERAKLVLNWGMLTKR